MKFEKLKALRDKLADHFHDRNDMYEKIDDCIHCNWELPAEVKAAKWIRTVVTTDPTDAIQTTVRTYSTHMPKFRMTPLANTPPNREKANEIEQILRWHWKQASNRAQVRPLWDIVESAARYAMVACQVVYLPCQFETYKTMGKTEPRAKASMAKSPFVVVTHHPSGVYPQYSDMLLEGVLVEKTMLADDFVNFWGDRAKDIKKKLDETESTKYVTYWDYKNYDERVVYANIGEGTDEMAGGGFEIVNESNPKDMPFEWVVKTWGNTLDEASDYRVNPMLAGIVQTGQWDTQNILESVGTSLVIQRAAAPVAYDETPSGEGLDTDYSEPATTVHGTSGLTKYQPLPPVSVDPQVAEYIDRFGGRMSKATVARVLQNLEFPSGTSYSSVSSILDAAQSAIAPYKILAQDVVADIAKKMLEWAFFWKDDLSGYASSRSKKGERYTLKADEFDPAEMDIEVVLTPYLPIDQVALFNAGILANKNLKVPLGRILEDAGYEDSDSVMEEWEQERQDENAVSLDLRQQQLNQDMAMQAQQMQMQMAQEQAMMQQQAQMGQAQQQATAQAGAGQAPEQPVMEATNNPAFSPAQGGTPPVQVNPGIGRKRGRPNAGTGLK